MIALLPSALLLSFTWPTPKVFSVGNLTYGVVRSSTASPRAPTLISLTGAMADTLGCNTSGVPDACYYSNACEFLVPSGWACASLDLPSHGAQVQPGEPEGIAGWRWRLERGQNPVAQNTERVAAMVADLIRRNVSDAQQFAISGISRGGFMAAHVATDSLVAGGFRAVGLLSPVTNLSLLTGIIPWIRTRMQLTLLVEAHLLSSNNCLVHARQNSLAPASSSPLTLTWRSTRRASQSSTCGRSSATRTCASIPIHSSS